MWQKLELLKDDEIRQLRRRSRCVHHHRHITSLNLVQNTFTWKAGTATTTVVLHNQRGVRGGQRSNELHTEALSRNLESLHNNKFYWFPFRHFVTLSSSCQPWSQSPSWKITPIDYFHGFSLRFYEAHVIVLRRFHGVKCCETKRRRFGLFDPIQAECLFQKGLRECFHSSVITECENVVRLHWNWARRRESRGHRQQSLFCILGEMTNIWSKFLYERNLHIKIFCCQILLIKWLEWCYW